MLQSNAIALRFSKWQPTAVLFHRTFQIAAGVGTAKMWKDPDFGTRSYSTRIQGSTPKDKNYWRDLLRAGLGAPLFSSAEKSHRLNFLDSSVDHHRGLFPFNSQGCQLVQESGRGTASEMLQH